MADQGHVQRRIQVLGFRGDPVAHQELDPRGAGEGGEHFFAHDDEEPVVQVGAHAGPRLLLLRAAARAAYAEGGDVLAAAERATSAMAGVVEAKLLAFDAGS